MPAAASYLSERVVRTDNSFKAEVRPGRPAQVRTAFLAISGESVQKGHTERPDTAMMGSKICIQILFRQSGVRRPRDQHRRCRLLSGRFARNAAARTRGLSAAPNRSRSCISAARIVAARRSARPSDALLLTHSAVSRDPLQGICKRRPWLARGVPGRSLDP